MEARHLISRKYGSLYLWVGGIVSIWFTVGLGLPFLIWRRKELDVGAWISVHIITAAVFSWLCLFNICYTPFQGKSSKFVHRWVGIAFLVFGFVSAVSGFIATWFERRSRLSLAFCLGITFGGVLQLMTQVKGYMAILRYKQSKKKEISPEAMKALMRQHAGQMTMAFFGGCLVPAFMRLPTMLGLPTPYGWVVYCPILPNLLGRAFLAAYRRSTFG